MPASYVVEFYDRVPGYRMSWPRAKSDESACHVIKCRVCWPRAKNYFAHNYPQASTEITLMNQKQAYSCLIVPGLVTFYY